MNLHIDPEGAEEPEVDLARWTALEFACDRGHSAIVARLVRVPEIMIVPPHARAYHSEECVRILSETGKASWNITTWHGDSPVRDALKSGHDRCFEIMLRQPDIDFNPRECREYPSIIHCAISGDTERYKFVKARFHSGFSSRNFMN